MRIGHQMPQQGTHATDATVAATALVAAGVSLGLNVPAFVLMHYFDFPDILRRPAFEALSLFAKNQSPIVTAYYAFALASLVLIPLALLTRRLLGSDRPSLGLDLATILGILAGLTQALGYLRWPFMEPALAAMYFAPDATAATKDGVLVVHEALNRYVGVAIGEHLGWLLQGTSLITLGTFAIRNPTRWMPVGTAAVVLFCGGCMVLSSVEQFGIRSRLVEVIFYLGYVMWTILLLPWAIMLGFRARRRTA